MKVFVQISAQSLSIKVSIFKSILLNTRSIENWIKWILEYAELEKNWLLCSEGD